MGVPFRRYSTLMSQGSSARESTPSYSMVDDKHFTVNAEVEISDQFFGWLLGFGKRVKVLYPNDVVEDFKAYLDKVREMY